MERVGEDAAGGRKMREHQRWGATRRGDEAGLGKEEKSEGQVRERW